MSEIKWYNWEPQGPPVGFAWIPPGSILTSGCRQSIQCSDFKTNTIKLDDAASQNMLGRVLPATVSYNMFNDEYNARMRGSKVLAMQSYPLASLQVQVNRNQFRKKVGDLFRLTYPKYNIVDMACRIVRLEEESIESEKIILFAIEAIEYVAGYTPPIKRDEDPDCQIWDVNCLVGGTSSAESSFGFSLPSGGGTAYVDEKACDGDEDTFWMAEECHWPTWWQYDLGFGNEKIIERVLIKAYGGPDGTAGTVRHINIKLSNDGVTWYQFKFSEQANNENWQEHLFKNEDAFRMLRVYVEDQWDMELPPAIREIQAMECLGQKIPKAVCFYPVDNVDDGFSMGGVFHNDLGRNEFGGSGGASTTTSTTTTTTTTTTVTTTSTTV
jgi:hypothetical protein